MACDGIPAALRNLTVAFVGDSLMDELYTLAQCMLPLGGARRFTLNLVPDQASLARLMRRGRCEVAWLSPDGPWGGTLVEFGPRGQLHSPD